MTPQRKLKMMKKKVAKNEHTGDSLRSKETNDNYREGWDRIFGKNTTPTPQSVELPKEK